jgi:hypothetical protein
MNVQTPHITVDSLTALVLRALRALPVLITGARYSDTIRMARSLHRANLGISYHASHGRVLLWVPEREPMLSTGARLFGADAAALRDAYLSDYYEWDREGQIIPDLIMPTPTPAFQRNQS